MDTPAPVMVGVDGSVASIRAALWAADEAGLRDTALDLVYVVDPARVSDFDEGMAEARHAIHRAWEAISDSGKQVKLESEFLRGDPGTELAKAAERAALLCIGHKGAKDSGSRPRGATAATLIRTAPTSVAVIRRQHTGPPTFHRWIVAVLDDSEESHTVLQRALEEALLREAPVLALTTWSEVVAKKQKKPVPNVRAAMDRYLHDRKDDPADVQLCILPLPHDLATMLEQSASIDQLFVIGASRRNTIDQFFSARARKVLRGTNCSIMVVRGATPEPGTASPVLAPSWGPPTRWNR